MAQEQKENVTAATAAEDLQEVQTDTEVPEEPKRPLTAKEKRAARAAAARQEAESDKGAFFHVSVRKNMVCCFLYSLNCCKFANESTELSFNIFNN